MKARHQTALDMRERQGATFKAIGDVLGVSPSRANLIYQRALIIRTEQLAGLRMRSIRILRASTRTADELAAVIEQDPGQAFLALLQEPNCDRGHAEEIIAWLAAGNREIP